MIEVPKSVNISPPGSLGQAPSPLDIALHQPGDNSAFQLSMGSTNGNDRTTQMGGHQFSNMGSISGIHDNQGDNLNRVTGLSPTQFRATSREDANLLLFLQENEENGVYLHDMG